MKTIIPESIQVIIGQRGFGKLAYLKEILPVLMAKNDFISTSYKATTIIKLTNYDDCFVLYCGELRKHYPLFISKMSKRAQMDCLKEIAAQYQAIFAVTSNTFYGGFRWGD